MDVVATEALQRDLPDDDGLLATGEERGGERFEIVQEGVGLAPGVARERTREG